MRSFYKKIMFLSGLYALVILAIIFYILLPEIRNLKENNKTLAEKRNELNANFSKLNTLQKYEKYPNEIKSISDAVNNLWPDNLDVSHFIIQSENLAKEKNLILENFSIDEAKNVKSTQTKSTGNKENEKETTGKKEADKAKKSLGTQFTFTTKSSYSSILDLIKGLEDLPRFNTVSALTLNGTDEGNVDLRLTGQVYYGK